MKVSFFVAYDDRFKSIELDKDPCTRFTYNCHPRVGALTLQVALFSSWLLWILLWLYYVYKAVNQLKKRPWHRSALSTWHLKSWRTSVRLNVPRYNLLSVICFLQFLLHLQASSGSMLARQGLGLFINLPCGYHLSCLCNISAYFCWSFLLWRQDLEIIDPTL